MLRAIARRSGEAAVAAESFGPMSSASGSRTGSLFWIGGGMPGVARGRGGGDGNGGGAPARAPGGPSFARRPRGGGGGGGALRFAPGGAYCLRAIGACRPSALFPLVNTTGSKEARERDKREPERNQIDARNGRIGRPEDEAEKAAEVENRAGRCSHGVPPRVSSSSARWWWLSSERPCSTSCSWWSCLSSSWWCLEVSARWRAPRHIRRLPAHTRRPWPALEAA